MSEDDQKFYDKIKERNRLRSLKNKEIIEKLPKKKREELEKKLKVAQRDYRIKRAKKMTYQVTEENNISTVFLNGEIDMDVTDKAKDVILPLIEAGKEVHINLKDVEYMDSSGISVLIESHQKATELGTKVTLKEISKSVLKVIMMAKLEQILNLD